MIAATSATPSNVPSNRVMGVTFRSGLNLTINSSKPKNVIKVPAGNVIKSNQWALNDDVSKIT